MGTLENMITSYSTGRIVISNLLGYFNTIIQIRQDEIVHIVSIKHLVSQYFKERQAIQSFNDFLRKGTLLQLLVGM